MKYFEKRARHYETVAPLFKEIANLPNNGAELVINPSGINFFSGFRAQYNIDIWQWEHGNDPKKLEVYVRELNHNGIVIRGIKPGESPADLTKINLTLIDGNALEEVVNQIHSRFPDIECPHFIYPRVEMDVFLTFGERRYKPSLNWCDGFNFSLGDFYCGIVETDLVPEELKPKMILERIKRGKMYITKLDLTEKETKIKAFEEEWREEMKKYETH